VKGKKFAKAHHFDNPGKLPARAKKKKLPKRGQRTMTNKKTKKR
jgi:hypothetical protein